MSYVMPRLVIAGLSGGSGKTLLSAGLARALTRKGYRVQTFKKGPDYIDTLWLSLASGYPPRNLDPFMIAPELLPHFFVAGCQSKRPGLAIPDLAIIEGNRGLFDGQDLAGSSSTAEVARRLAAPVLLAMNCSKMTRTAAAIVLGLKNFEPDLNLAGVILNLVSRSRHRSIVKQAVEELAGLPVLGLLPRLAEAPFEERASGLYGTEAALAAPEAFKRLDLIADFVEEHVDLEAIVRLAQSAPPLEVPTRPTAEQSPADPTLEQTPTRSASSLCVKNGSTTQALKQHHKQAGVEQGPTRPTLEQAPVDLTIEQPRLRPVVAQSPVRPTASEPAAAARRPEPATARPALEYPNARTAVEQSPAPPPADPILEQSHARAATETAAARPTRKPRLGYVRDQVLWFYYSENLEALEAAGAELLPLSLLDERPWPELDGLYLGGGFPGDFASQLADKQNKKQEVAALIRGGLPTYAEGPGFYYLARSLNVNGVAYPLAGVFDFDLVLGKVPRGIGYVQAVVERPNPFHPLGSIIKAHEFHYTDIGLPGELAANAIMRLDKGNGMFRAQGQHGRDGLLAYNCFISHLQIFAPGAPHWASAFVAAAARYSTERHKWFHPLTPAGE